MAPEKAGGLWEDRGGRRAVRKEGGGAPPPQQAISKGQLKSSDPALPGAGGAPGSLPAGPPVPSLSRAGTLARSVASTPVRTLG